MEGNFFFKDLDSLFQALTKPISEDCFVRLSAFYLPLCFAFSEKTLFEAEGDQSVNKDISTVKYWAAIGYLHILASYFVDCKGKPL